jgi:hypothetical protein
MIAGICESVGRRDFLNHIAKSIGVPSHQTKIPFRLIQLFRDLFLFVSFCRHQVTKNLFAEVLFQIDLLICKPRDFPRFDFWDFVLPKNGVICLVPRQLPHFFNGCDCIPKTSKLNANLFKWALDSGE